MTISRGCIGKLFATFATNNLFVVSSMTVLLVSFQIMFVSEQFET